MDKQRNGLDKSVMLSPVGRPFRILMTALIAFAATAAEAIVGGHPVEPGAAAARWTVRVEGSKGQLCSGVALDRMIVLTAAHCVLGGGPFRVVAAGRTMRVEKVLTHSSFQPGHTPNTQPGVDLAMLQLQRPLPAAITPTEPGGAMATSEAVTIAGFGLSEEGRDSTARRLRKATLTTAGTYTAVNSVVVAVDPQRRGTLPGAGACRGDSGGPVMRGQSAEIVGLISWSSAPMITSGRRVCGGFTAITPLADNRDWINATKARLKGSAGADDAAPAWSLRDR